MASLSRSKIYGSNLVLSPDGTPMFRCTDKRLEWYLHRNLAIKIDDKTVRLTFQPAGLGHAGQGYYLEEKENQCVVCGCKTELTKHHVVPRNYRRFMPDAVKSRDHHDVVLLCEPCHRGYENLALPLKQKLAEDCGDAMSKVETDLAKVRIRKIAHALREHSERMPKDRRLGMQAEVEAYLGHEPSPQEIDELCELECQRGGGPYGQIVVEVYKDRIQEFVELWRKHFIGVMKPEFLPASWRVDHPVGKRGR